MKGAVRPFYPGPLVIQNDAAGKPFAPPRRVVGVGVEEGPLTDAEQRQFLPPRSDKRVRAANIAALVRQGRISAARRLRGRV